MPAFSSAAPPASGTAAGTPGRRAEVVAARNLWVTFRSRGGPVDALRGVDLGIPEGALFALLGPNGAGKTTLMRCITGLVEPTGGAISVFGGERGGSRARLARMGVLIENPGQYGRLDAGEYLSFFGSFYAVPDLRDRIRGLCAELGLELDGKPIAKLSQGNRQKLQLARSLLHRPELLLWDEPTDHLDPVSQRAVLAYLRGYLAESGATALVATHRLEQLETAATHFGFLARGILKAAGARAQILDGAASGGGSAPGAMGRARLGFARPVRPEELAWLAPAFPVRIEPAFGDGTLVDLSGPELRERMPEIIKSLVDRDLPLASVEPYRTSLADVYQRLVGP
ncbi:MAG TPA: ABC transporter ATP-binding protein [Fibrobacteria bacterium]|nr:ABC transporter ATP-binding protein [Fibrobacteria bacterium]